MYQKTTSNLFRIHLKGKLRFGNGSPLEGAMYINLYGKILRGIPKMLGFINFLKILMVSDKNNSQGLIKFIIQSTLPKSNLLGLKKIASNSREKNSTYEGLKTIEYKEKKDLNRPST